MIPLGGFVRSSFGLLCFGTRRGTLGLHAISEKHRTAGVKNWGGAPRNLLKKYGEVTCTVRSYLASGLK